MKKTFVLGVLVPFALCITSCTSGSGKMARASDEAGTELAALINSYQKDGQYTKKSTIYFNDEAMKDAAIYFHAGATVLKRTTYYDETVNALYMCDIGGTSATTVNGGYAADDDNMVRYHFEETESVDLEKLFDKATYKADYTVANTSPKDFFYVLSDLATLVSGKTDWAVSDGLYTHNITDLELVDGEYNDPYLKGFQYFAAPMLLQNAGGAEAYLTFDRITVESTSGALSIKLYVDEVDEGKLYSEGGLLAEARIYTGHVIPGYYLVGTFGTEYDWQIVSGIALDDTDLESWDVAKKENAYLGKGQYKICRLQEDGYTSWIGHAKTDENFYMPINGITNLNVYDNGEFWANIQSYSVTVSDITEGEKVLGDLTYLYAFDDKGSNVYEVVDGVATGVNPSYYGYIVCKMSPDNTGGWVLNDHTVEKQTNDIWRDYVAGAVKGIIEINGLYGDKLNGYAA